MYGYSRHYNLRIMAFISFVLPLYDKMMKKPKIQRDWRLFKIAYKKVNFVSECIFYFSLVCLVSALKPKV